MAVAQIFNRIGQLGLGLALTSGVLNSALYNVDGGHRAVIFDRFQGRYVKILDFQVQKFQFQV